MRSPLSQAIVPKLVPARGPIAAGASGCAALLLAGASLAVLAPPASAQTVKAFQVVGVTSSNVQGNDGVAGLSRECQLEFPASRMCSSTEVLNTVNFPDGSFEAWVRPVFSPISTGAGREVLDAAGQSQADDGNLSCQGWSRNNSDVNGLTVDQDGAFRTRACNTNRPVACCALIPVPEPPTSMLRGGAAATLAAAGFLRARP